MKNDDISQSKGNQLVKHSFTEKETAEYIGMSVSFLRQSRSNGDRSNRTTSPDYIKIGRSVRYLKTDLDIWLEKLRRSPSEYLDVLDVEVGARKNKDYFK